MNERIFNPGKRELAKLYKTQSTIQIAKHYGVNPETVRKRLKEHGIEARPSGQRREFHISKRKLTALYQVHSLREIAALLGVGQTVVFKRLKEYGIEFKAGDVRSSRQKGKLFSLEHRQNLSAAHKGLWAGEKNPNWRGGVHRAHMSLRATGEYKQWKIAALERVGYCCQSCGVEQYAVCECCGTKIVLHVHHKLSFAKYPESRFDPSNSEVLCPKCHHSRHH